MKKNALYYQIKKNESFTAEVLSCEEVKKAPEGLSVKGTIYCVSLSEEGFYPEGGGQPSDRGTIGEAKLLSVQEDLRGDSEELPLLHYVDRPLLVGQSYPCSPDWEFRMENSRNHSGEHIISGLVHKKFSYDNVGFHMALQGENPCMTIDFSGEISWEELLEIEREANAIVLSNREIRIFYPEESELSELPYRSKKELSGAVRLVEIPGADLCACCGTHVEYTGEIGPIKLLSMMRHRGGVRVEMICGELAVLDYEKKQEAAVRAAQLLSVPVEGLAAAVEKQKDELQGRDFRIGGLNERYFKLKAEFYRLKLHMEKERDVLKSDETVNTEDTENAGTGLAAAVLCDFEEGMNSVELRKCCDYLMRNTGASVVAVFLPKDAGIPEGEPQSYFYVIGSLNRDLRAGGKSLNASLQGRGGGQAGMLQGTLQGSRTDIENVVKEIWG